MGSLNYLQELPVQSPSLVKTKVRLQCRVKFRERVFLRFVAWSSLNFHGVGFTVTNIR